jgi:hypothetical protein
MSSLALGAIVVATGVLAYALNYALKPAGWTKEEPDPVA